MKIPNYPSIEQFRVFVELKDYRPPTKKGYVRYPESFRGKLAEHFQCDPAILSEDQLRQYFLFLREHKRYTRSPMKVAKYSIRCFFRDCLKLGPNWTVFQEVRIAAISDFSLTFRHSSAVPSHGLGSEISSSQNLTRSPPLQKQIARPLRARSTRDSIGAPHAITPSPFFISSSACSGQCYPFFVRCHFTPPTLCGGQ